MANKIKTLFMETTEIAPEQTASQIQRILGEHGASAIMTEYKDKEVVALCFKINFKNQEIPFKLPCRWEAIYQIFLNRPRKKMISNEEALQMKYRAKKVAWRQILRWVEAQMAFINTNMVNIHEVFLPYRQVGINGETLTEEIERKGGLYLTHQS